MGFAAYTGAISISVTDSPAAAAPNSSLPFGTQSNSTNIPIKTSYTLGTSTAGEINEVATGVLTIVAGGSGTFHLQALTDMLGATNVVLVRLKKYIFWLLSPLDDPTSNKNSSGVTIGAAGTNPNNLNMGGTSPTMKLSGGGTTGSGDKQVYISTTANGLPVSSTAEEVLVTNDDGTNAAALYYNLGGSTS